MKIPFARKGTSASQTASDDARGTRFRRESPKAARARLKADLAELKGDVDALYAKAPQED